MGTSCVHIRSFEAHDRAAARLSCSISSSTTQEGGFALRKCVLDLQTLFTFCDAATAAYHSPRTPQHTPSHREDNQHKHMLNISILATALSQISKECKKKEAETRGRITNDGHNNARREYHNTFFYGLPYLP